MTPVIVKDTNAVYHGKKEFVGSSTLKKYLKSSLQKKYEDDNPTDPTATMITGTQYHSYVLEPETFHQNYIIYDPADRPYPSENFRNRDNKYWKDNILAKGEDRVLSVELFEHMQRAKEHLFTTSPFAKHLLTGGENELSHYLEYDGIKVKFRADSILTRKAVICDLKTTGDASKHKFPRHAADLKYHLSAGMYTTLAEEVYKTGQVWKFYIVAQELTPPYDFNIFRYQYKDLLIGVYEFEQALYEHDYCTKTGRFEGYQEFSDNKYGIIDLEIPNYMIKEYNFNHF